VLEVPAPDQVDHSIANHAPSVQMIRRRNGPIAAVLLVVLAFQGYFVRGLARAVKG